MLCFNNLFPGLGSKSRERESKPLRGFVRIFLNSVVFLLFIGLVSFFFTKGAIVVKANSLYSALFTKAQSSYLKITDNSGVSAGDNDFTLSGWVYFNTVPGSPDGIISKWDNVAGRKEYIIYKDGNNHLGLLASSDGTTLTTNLTDTAVVTTSTWYFLVAWYDSVANKAYFQINNGTPMEGSHAGGIFDGPTDFKIGSWATGNYLDGRVDNVGLWKRTLTSTERSRIYNSGIALSYQELDDTLKQNLTSWWDFDEASGTRNDSIGTNNLTDVNTNVTQAAGVNSVAPPDPSIFLNHLLSTGQSLSNGQDGSPALSITQPYSNVMLSGSSLVPLVESSVETMSSGMANFVTAQVPGNDYQIAVTRHGQSSAAYSALKKGTTPYTNGIAQVNSTKTAANNAGKSYKVIGVTTIHGESDHVNGTSQAQYEADLVEWQNDYETDVKAITGQTGTIPLFTDQMEAWTGYGSTTSVIPYAQLAASENNPEKIILVGPKYFFIYATSGGHLINTSYRWLGEYYGKIINKVVVNGETWKPLRPRTIVRSGSDIYARFYVPVTPIVFDITNVLEKTNMGFEYTDDSGTPPSISNVEIVDTETVKVSLNQTPTGSNQKLRYAYTGTSGAKPGADQAGSARGNLRDSDSTASLYGNNLYNWSVNFDKTVTADSTAPTISNLVITPDITTASLTWDTNEDSSTIVDYGLTSSYGNSTTETDKPTRISTHSKSLSNLVACTTYHYRARSKDLAQNAGTTIDDTFTTSGCTGSATINSQTSSQITTASGGSLNLLSSSKGITLTIPVSFAATDANFQIKQLDRTAVTNTTSTPTGYSLINSYIYDLKALSDISTTISTFTNPITVAITYGSSDISGIDETNMLIYRWDGSAWQQLTGCAADVTTTTVSCTTTHFSIFGLFGKPPVSSSSSSSSSSTSSSTSAPSCGNQAPGAKTPWLYGAITQNSSSILLYFTEADNPVTKYVLTYGAKSGEYQYGVQDMGVNERNQMTYLVKSLSPNTTYYFKIRAQNGCATGNWSNEISAKTKGNISFNNLDFTESELTPIVDDTPVTDSCQTYNVKSGDTLWAIAKSELGDGSKYPEIIEQNKDTYSSLTTSNNLNAGWELKVNCGAKSKQNEEDTTQDIESTDGYKVKVKVLDTDKKPVEGAKVTIHSKEQEAITGKDGVAQFTDVEAGDHRVLIAYKNFEGEQSVNLTGDVKEFSFNVTVQEKPFSLSPLAWGIIGILVLIITILIVVLVKRKK